MILARFCIFSIRAGTRTASNHCHAKFMESYLVLNRMHDSWTKKSKNLHQYTSPWSSCTRRPKYLKKTCTCTHNTMYDGLAATPMRAFHELGAYATAIHYYYFVPDNTLWLIRLCVHILHGYANMSQRDFWLFWGFLRFFVSFHSIFGSFPD